MCENFTKEYLYSKEFRDESNIIKLLSQYNKLPLFVLKFSLLVCKDTVYSAIVSLLKECNVEHNILIETILSARNVKLCDNKIFASLCSKKCICDKNIQFKNLYKNLTNLIKVHPSILEDITFVNNYSTLLQKTNVYDSSLYECMKNFAYTDKIDPIIIINMIVQGRLLTEKYQNIIVEIFNKQKDLAIKNTCRRVQEMIYLHNAQCTLIDYNIYISNSLYANNMASIIDNSYNCIVSLTMNDNIIPVKSENIDYYEIEISDNTDDDFISKTENIVKIILETIGTKKILIYCSKGQSRSVIFTALVIKYKNSINFIKALKFIKSHRKQALPNPDIINQINKKISGE